MKAIATVPGTRFGKLTLVSDAEPQRSSGRPWRAWVLRCDCGALVIKRVNAVSAGRALGCSKCLESSRLRHGEARNGNQSKEYLVWSGMMRRCYTATSKGYAYYGGRGITVDPSWRKYENFLRDMGRRPADGMQIDRIDSDGNYGPGNCRWVTPRENARNRRNNVIATIGEQTGCVASFIPESGKVRNRVYRRLREGWSPDEALLTPAIPVEKRRSSGRRG